MDIFYSLVAKVILYTKLMHSEACVLVVKNKGKYKGFNNKLVNMQAVRSAQFQPNKV